VPEQPRSADQPTAEVGRSPTPRHIGLWWRRLLADQGLEKILATIRIRQYELKSLIDERALRAGASEEEAAELTRRVERARALAEEQPIPNDRASANELLDKLDGILPFIADDDRLRLMLEEELDRPDTALRGAQSERALALLDHDPDAPLPAARRRRLEVLLASAVRHRDDALREERITSELRLNYLTWLGLVLLLLLPAVFAAAALTAHSGLWADIALSMFAGGLGGTLSGVLRLRSPESGLTALKNLGLVMLVQPLLGGVRSIIK